MFPSRWLASADLEGRTPTVTIRSITVERVGAPPQDENKYVMWFEGKDKGLILNKTNGVATGQLYGDETDNWMGKSVQLYTQKVRAFGATHDAIRIRKPSTISAAPSAPVEAEPEDVAEYDEPTQVDGPSYIDSLDDAPADTAAHSAQGEIADFVVSGDDDGLHPDNYMPDSLDDAPEDTAAHVATTPVSNGDNPFDDDGWGNWSTMDDFKAAGEWAASRGNWKARKHLNNAWLKCKRENDGDNNPAEFMAAWRIVVNDHVSQPAA